MIQTLLAGSSDESIEIQDFTLIFHSVMARNEEKQHGKLNRLFLQKEREAWAKKHPKRPHLASLNTAEEIRQWLPIITHEIDICLKQTECTSYSERKIEELQEKIKKLEREYKSFVRKINLIKPSSSDVSLLPAPNISESEEPKNLIDPASFKRIEMPILETETKDNSTPIVWNVNPDTEDKPLEISHVEKIVHRKPDSISNKVIEDLRNIEQSASANSIKIKNTFGLSSDQGSSKTLVQEVDYSHVKKMLIPRTSQFETNLININNTNILGLHYSSSESDDD